MSMNELQFLTWVRGPGLDIAVGIFLLGVVWRLFEIYSLGRKRDLSAPRSAIRLVSEVTMCPWLSGPGRASDLPPDRR